MNLHFVEMYKNKEGKDEVKQDQAKKLSISLNAPFSGFSLCDKNHFTQLDKNHFTQLVSKETHYINQAESINFTALKQRNPIGLFHSILPEKVISNLCLSLPCHKEDYNLKGDPLIKKYLANSVWKSIISSRLMPTLTKQIFKNFKRVKKHRKCLKLKFKSIKKKFNKISVNNFRKESAKICSVIEKINLAISQVYLPSKELLLSRKSFCFKDGRKLRFLLLTDAKTGFLVRMTLEPFHPNHFNRAVVSMLESFSNRGFTLHLKLSFLDTEIMLMLQKRGISAFGLLKTHDLNSNGGEIYENQEHLHLISMKNYILLSNLPVIEMGKGLITSNNQIPLLFDLKFEKFKAIKIGSGARKHDISDLYELFVIWIFEIASKNAYILGEVLQNSGLNKAKQKGEASSQARAITKEEFQSQIFKCLLG